MVGTGVTPHNNRIQPNNVPVTEEAERGHECLSWVDLGSSSQLIERSVGAVLRIPESDFQPLLTRKQNFAREN
jgi:hypothetical protein